MKSLKKSRGLLKIPMPGSSSSLSQTVTNILVDLGFKVSVPVANEPGILFSISVPELCEN